MAEEVKAQRLSKVAKDLGVGIGSITDFLATKKIVVDGNPNSKIEPDVLAVLMAEFAGDVKQKHAVDAKATHIREMRETITIAEAKKKKDSDETEVEPDIDYSRFKRKIEVKEAPPKPAPVVAEKPKPVVEKVQPKEGEPVAEKAEEEKPAKKTSKKKTDEEPAKEEKELVKAKGKKAAGVTLVDKIELEEEKPKTKGGKKKAEPAKPEVKELKKPEPVVEIEKPEPAPEKEVIRVKSEKLSGTKQIGKIDLPVEQPKKKQEVKQDQSKKPATDSDAHKRKRKRISKVDINRQQELDRRQRVAAPAAGEKKTGPSEADIQREISATLARLGGHGKSRSSKFRREKRQEVARKSEQQSIRDLEESTVLKLTEFVTVSELATMMSKSPTEIIQACMQLGIFASINQRLDAETIHIIAEEFGYQVEFVSAEVSEAIQDEQDKPEQLESRPPVVTVMGHVDHGKTSLLDFIRSATVVAGEAGGITQHIGAYSVQLPNGRKITFLDTPGHEAFTAMRARGAQVTDLAIIVVAADDSVMPQTKEAISHAQAAGVPMIFAINKIDKQDANPEKIREQLSQMNILVESWGGKFQDQLISAKKGTHVDELLEKVLVEADMLELKANPNKRATGTIIESALDKGRGYIATILVEAGTLRVGDPILAGTYSGRVKAMFNERGQKIEEAGPSTPASILGFEGAPRAGDRFHAMEDEREAREIATKRNQLQREQSVRTRKHLTIEEIGRRIALGDFKELNLIVKGDVDGSVEALTDALQKLSTEKIAVRIIHKGVGQISESDVLLATASDAIIIGFQVRPSHTARTIAEKEEIQIRLYSVIYKAIEEMKEAMEGLLSARIEERILGTAEVREVFNITKVGNVAGCMVVDGTIARTKKIRLIRDGIVIYTGALGSLKRFKDDVKEVQKGYDCGLNIEKFNDIKVGDNIESFEEVEVKQTL